MPDGANAYRAYGFCSPGKRSATGVIASVKATNRQAG